VTVLTASSAMFTGLSVSAQQINGTPGSPSATQVIDGTQLPPPPLPFGGVIKEDAKDSTPYWPPPVVPPKGAPNVLLIMTDDQGYGVSGTFGGVIPTPAMDRVAAAGLRYTQFHSTVFDFKYDGPGPGKGGTGVLLVDGRELAHKTIAHTIPMIMAIDETFDVGMDNRTGVDDSYELPFKFTGTIDKLTFKLGPSQLLAADQKAVDEIKKSADN
jgi:hypothetical protein